MTEKISLTFEELYEGIEANYAEFSENHTIFMEKGNAAAGNRARKAITNLKKLVTDYRKANIEKIKEAKISKKG